MSGGKNPKQRDIDLVAAAMEMVGDIGGVHDLGTGNDATLDLESTVSRSEGSEAGETIDFDVDTAGGDSADVESEQKRPAVRAGGSREGNAVQADGSVSQSHHKVFGDFEILEVLGRGGMGVVFKARQRSLGRLVALKMIRTGLFADTRELVRFQNEVESVAALDHPNIVPVLEFGEVGKQKYFTMKLVEGGTLSRRIESLQAHPRETASLVAAIAKAVFHAHQRGILHRDLKPGNILIDSEGTPYVTDFGLARRMDAVDGLTATGEALGTPSYMAPEQAAGKVHELTTATDVYGLGAILYAVLTNRAPFQGDSVLHTLEMVRSGTLEPPRSLNPLVDRDLDLICMKCLEREPSRRYATASGLAEDLENYLAGRPIQARAVGRMERFVRLCRRHPLESALMGSLLAVLLAFATGGTWAAVRIASQRDEIAGEKKVSDSRLELYRDSVSSFVNRAPQLLEGVPLSGGMRQELSSLVEGLFETEGTASAAVGPASKWGLAAVAIRRGDKLLEEAQALRVEGATDEVDKKLLEAEQHFVAAIATTKEVLDAGEGDRAKGLGNYALSLSRLAAQQQLARDPAAVESYRQAIALRREAAALDDAEEPAERRVGELGRSLTNYAEYLYNQHSPELDRETQESTVAADDVNVILKEASAVMERAVELVPEGEKPRPNLLRDYILTYQLLGQLEQSQRRYEEARRAYESCIAACQQLMELEPLRMSHGRLWVNLNNTLGDLLLVQMNDPQGARSQYVQGMLYLRRSVLSDPVLTELQENGLAMGYYRLGIAAVAMGNMPQAQQYFERCELIRELDYRQRGDSAAAKGDPDILLRSQIALMLARARAGKGELVLEGARALAERAQHSGTLPDGLTSQQLLLHAAAMIGIVAEQTIGEEGDLLRAEGVRWVEQAIATGYDDFEYLSSDPDLLPLKKSAAFVQLLTNAAARE